MACEYKTLPTLPISLVSHWAKVIWLLSLLYQDGGCSIVVRMANAKLDAGRLGLPQQSA